MKELIIREPFKWLDVLTQITNGATVSEAQAEILSGKSGDWHKCACGELCKQLPQRESMTGRGTGPVDSGLSDLGIEFCGHVSHSQWDDALAIYHKIEARTGELLIEMGVIK